MPAWHSFLLLQLSPIELYQIHSPTVDREIIKLFRLLNILLYSRMHLQIIMTVTDRDLFVGLVIERKKSYVGTFEHLRYPGFISKIANSKYV